MDQPSRIGGESRDTFANQKSPDSLALQGVPSDHAVAAGLLSLTMHDAGGRSAPIDAVITSTRYDNGKDASVSYWKKGS